MRKLRLQTPMFASLCHDELEEGGGNYGKLNYCHLQILYFIILYYILLQFCLF